MITINNFVLTQTEGMLLAEQARGTHQQEQAWGMIQL
jgi:hypothetical protein